MFNSRFHRKPAVAPLPEHLFTVPALCCNNMMTYRTYQRPTPSFAATPLLESLSQRVNTKVASPSLPRGPAAAGGAGGVGTAPGVSQSLNHVQRQSSLQAAGSTSAEESQQIVGSEPERLQSLYKAERGMPHNSPAIIARRTLQNALSNGKAIAHWLLSTIVWGPFRLGLAIFRSACVLVRCRGLSSDEAPSREGNHTVPDADQQQQQQQEVPSQEPHIRMVPRLDAGQQQEEVVQQVVQQEEVREVPSQKPHTRRVPRLASGHVELIMRERFQARGEVYSGVDMEELFPSCWTPVDKELGKLGEGTYASVVYAELDIMGEITTLAVKVMKDTADFAMMDAEIEALATVRGKPRFIQDVAKYHQVEDEDSPLLIVTRLLEGVDLALMMHVLRQELKLPGGFQKYCRAVVRLFSQIVEGVQQLHSLGRSHNDLKPENILVRNWSNMNNLEVVIIDIAGSMRVGSWDHLSMPQATAAFSAPDVVAASAHRAISDEEWTVPVDFLAHDKWSLGCLLSFVLSGCCAFDRPSNQSGVPPSQPSLEEVFADVQRRQKEWGHAFRGEPIPGALPNAVEVLSNTLSGDKLLPAQQLVRSLLNPNAEARIALADINLGFLLQ